MILRLSLRYLIISFLPPPAFTSTTTLKPDCPVSCGNLSISYPFGVGPDCSLDPSFHIICNTSTHTPKPYLFLYDHVEVIEIMPSQIRVENPYLLNAFCYDKSGAGNSSDRDRMWSGLSLLGTQYTFSEDNWLTTLGSDDLVLGIGEDDQRFGGGWVAYCKDSSNAYDFGFCPNNDIGYQR